VGVPIGFERKLRFPERLLDDTEIFPELCNLRLQPAGDLKLLFGQREASQLLERYAVLLMKHRLLRRQLDSLAQDRTGGLKRARVQREHAQPEPGTRLRRVEREHVLVEALCFGQPPSAMRLLRVAEETRHFAQMYFATGPSRCDPQLFLSHAE